MHTVAPEDWYRSGGFHSLTRVTQRVNTAVRATCAANSAATAEQVLHTLIVTLRARMDRGGCEGELADYEMLLTLAQTADASLLAYIDRTRHIAHLPFAEQQTVIERGWRPKLDPAGPPTQAELRYLWVLGYRGPKPQTHREAHQLIGEIKTREKK